jgi:hypothetical protein
VFSSAGEPFVEEAVLLGLSSQALQVEVVESLSNAAFNQAVSAS